MQTENAKDFYFFCFIFMNLAEKSYRWTEKNLTNKKNAPILL